MFPRVWPLPSHGATSCSAGKRSSSKRTNSTPDKGRHLDAAFSARCPEHTVVLGRRCEQVYLFFSRRPPGPTDTGHHRTALRCSQVRDHHESCEGSCSHTNAAIVTADRGESDIAIALHTSGGLDTYISSPIPPRSERCPPLLSPSFITISTRLNHPMKRLS